MEPMQKANGLIDKFYRKMPLSEFNNVAYMIAVKCSLICVDEILSMNLSLLLSHYHADSYRTFYTKVKDELLKIRGCEKCNNDGWVWRDAITGEKLIVNVKPKSIMKINVRSIIEIEPHAEMRAQSTLNINVDMDKHQKQNLFYTIWTDVGDDILQDWLNSEEKQMIDLPKCNHDFSTECIDDGELLYVKCTNCGEQLTGASMMDVMQLPLEKDVEAESKLVLASMYVKKRYDKDWTDEDLLNGLKLMCANYRKYLLKTV